MRELPDDAFRQLGVFTREQALAAGWSGATLSRRVADGSLIRLRRGVFASAILNPEPYAAARNRLAQRGAAAALRIDGATVSHAAAAAIHGLPLLVTPSIPCIILPPPYLTQRTDVHLHRHPIVGEQLDGNYGFAVTSVARSCIDLTRELGLPAGLVAADAAVHRGLTNKTELTGIYDQWCHGRAGLHDGRKLFELIDGKSESPLESISRLAMAGLPTPRTQVEIFTLDDRFLGRVDFFWDDLGVIGEADGRSKYTDDQLWKEKRRQDEFLHRGLVVERWTWETAQRPGALSAQLTGAFARAATLRAAGITPAVRVSRPERS